MNLNTQYSIIGGSAGAFVLVLVALFLTQTGDEPIPINPVAEQVIPIQTNDNDSTENDNRVVNRELPPSSEPEEIVESDIDPTSTLDSSSSNVQSSSSGGSGGSGGGSGRSGGGGGGGSNNGDDEDDEDSSSPTPGTWASIEATYR